MGNSPPPVEPLEGTQTTRLAMPKVGGTSKTCASVLPIVVYDLPTHANLLSRHLDTQLDYQCSSQGIPLCAMVNPIGGTFSRATEREYVVEHKRNLQNGVYEQGKSTGIVKVSDEIFTPDEVSAFPGQWTEIYTKWLETPLGVLVGRRKLIIVDFQHRYEGWMEAILEDSSLHHPIPFARVLNVSTTAEVLVRIYDPILQWQALWRLLVHPLTQKLVVW